MTGAQLVSGDGHLGIWGALANAYRHSKEQHCWNHRIVNVLDKVPRRDQYQGKEHQGGLPRMEQAVLRGSILLPGVMPVRRNFPLSRIVGVATSEELAQTGSASGGA